MAARFEGFGPEAYRKRNGDKPVEDLTKKQVGNEGTEAPDPASRPVHKQTTRKQRERSEWNSSN